MKIKSIDSEGVIFDNDNYLEDCFFQECCEINYADFEYLKQYSIFPNSKAKSVYELEFDEDNIHLKEDGQGFSFEDKHGNKLFVPCYSEQNGYYSSKVEICYYSKDGIIISRITTEGDWCSK